MSLFPLSSKSYEVIRWVVAIVLPAVGTFFATLAKAWGWNLPTEAILTTISALSLFLGAIFGISKVVNDKNQNNTEETPKK